jgi:hypothetical protein
MHYPERDGASKRDGPPERAFIRTAVVTEALRANEFAPTSAKGRVSAIAKARSAKAPE